MNFLKKINRGFLLLIVCILVVAIYLIISGVSSSKDKKEIIIDTASIEDAVKAAKSFAVKGDAVLLSPCCASFDLFDNYEHRGKLFKEEVLKS